MKSERPKSDKLKIKRERLMVVRTDIRGGKPVRCGSPSGCQTDTCGPGTKPI